MKRLTACAGLTALALLAAPATAIAEPTSPFGDTWTGRGSVVGDLTWYNRSVGVNGQVRDYEGAGSTTVQFEFYQASTLLDVQTRTASNGAKDFGWTEPGPAGGITRVDITLINDGDEYFVASVPVKR
jgi:opacity protein-like surface antigen